jgi:hypothetical protein
LSPTGRGAALGHTVTQIAAAPFFLASGLLVVSGAAKLARPDPASRALRSAGLPGNRPAVRGLGLVEIAVGAACLAAPGPGTAAALTTLYVAFALFLTRLMTMDTAVSSCGCVGAAESPPTVLHVLLNIAAASAGALAALAPPRALAPFAWSTPMHGVPFILGGVCAGYLAYLAAARLPEVLRLSGRSTA